MSVQSRVAAVLAAVVLAGGAWGQAVQPLEALPALQGLPERWSEVMDLFDVPGMAVAVVKDGIVYAQGFGVRDTGSGAPVTPDTMFYIASITKTYTASGIVALAADGKLSLDDPVKKHLARLALPDSGLTERITVRDLLCHRYGVNSSAAVLLDAYTGEITEDRYWHWLAQGEVAGEVRYTNPNFTLAGRVIEAVSGEPWRDFLDRRVFTPAGMERTTGYASELYGDENSATPTERVPPGGAWRATEQRKSDRTMHAAGGLGTSAADGARWLRLQLNNGEIDGERVLPEALTREMRAMQAEFKESGGSIRIEKGFGLAWTVGTFNERPLCMHGGGYAGTTAYMALLPEDGAGLVVLINAAGPARGLCDIVAIDLMERLTGTKAAWDVYANYTERIRKMKGESAAREQGAAPVLERAHLSRPIGLYTGWFRNEHLGTLIVGRTDDRLTVALGDMPLEAQGVAGERDMFVVLDDGEEDQRGTFLVDAHGSVTGVRVRFDDGSEHDFVR